MNEKDEIDKAINAIIEDVRINKSRIKVLRTLPRYRYAYTCPECGGHVPSHLMTDGEDTLQFCRFCSEKEEYPRRPRNEYFRI